MELGIVQLDYGRLLTNALRHSGLEVEASGPSWTVRPVINTRTVGEFDLFLSVFFCFTSGRFYEYSSACVIDIICNEIYYNEIYL